MVILLPSALLGAWLESLSRFRVTAFVVKTIHATPPIIVQELAEQIGIRTYLLIHDMVDMGLFAAPNQSIKPEVASAICENGRTLILTPHNGPSPPTLILTPHNDPRPPSS